MSEEIQKLQIAPEAVLDIVIFVGDGFQGEIWSRNETEIDGKKFIVIQWEPEDMLFQIIKQSNKSEKLIDKNTGRTITRKYPKARVQVVNDNPWSRRVVVFTNFRGGEVDLINIDRKLILDNETLKKENRELRNQVGSLWNELDLASSRLDEQIKSWVDKIKMAASVRGHIEVQQTSEMREDGYDRY